MASQVWNACFIKLQHYNQDLSGWDVSYFSAQPSGFSAYATSWDASNQPGWPNEPTDNCYKMSALGTIGTSGVCKDMLIVDKGALLAAKNTGYAIMVQMAIRTHSPIARIIYLQVKLLI